MRMQTYCLWYQGEKVTSGAVVSSTRVSRGDRGSSRGELPLLFLSNITTHSTPLQKFPFTTVMCIHTVKCIYTLVSRLL